LDHLKLENLVDKMENLEGSMKKYSQALKLIEKYLKEEIRETRTLNKIDENDFQILIETAIELNKILEESESYSRISPAIVRLSRNYINKFQKLIGERIKKMVLNITQNIRSVPNLTDHEKDVFEKLSTVIDDYYAKLIKKHKEELVIVRILQSLKEPLIDLDGRFVILESGDILRTKKSFAELLVAASVAAYEGGNIESSSNKVHIRS